MGNVAWLFRRVPGLPDLRHRLMVLRVSPASHASITASALCARDDLPDYEDGVTLRKFEVKET